jgi:Rap1a immunity proteins
MRKLLLAGGVSDPLQSPAVCATGGVTFGQERAVVMKFMTNHPELRHLQASTLVVWAMAEAFLCKAAKR